MVAVVKYGRNILAFYGFNLNLHINNIISLTDIMLVYQPIEVLTSVLYPTVQYGSLLGGLLFSVPPWLRFQAVLLPKCDV